VAPTNGSYEYVILPNATRAQVEAFAQAQASDEPIYEVLYATNTLHAVYDYSQSVLMIVNFANAPVYAESPVTGITYRVSTAGTIITQENEAQGDAYDIRVVIHDPTGTNADITVTMVGAVGSRLDSDDNVTVSPGADNIVINASQLTTFQNRRFNSWEARVMAIGLGGDFETPDPVRNLTATNIGHFGVELTWDAPENYEYLPGLLYVLTYYSPFAGSREIVLGREISSFTVFPLLDGANYVFTIEARNFGAVSDPASLEANIPAYNPAIPITFEEAEAGDTITDGALAGNPNWQFSSHGDDGNTHRVALYSGNKYLEVSSTVAGSAGEAIFRFPEITEGFVEFRYRVRTADTLNSVSLIGTANGQEARLITIQSDAASGVEAWHYEIQSNFTPGTATGGTNTRPSRVPAAFGQWHDIRILVDFDSKRATVLVGGQALVYNSPFRHHAGGATAVEYTAITGFNVLTRWGAAGSIQADDFYMTAQPLDGELTLHPTHAEVGDTLTANYDGRHMGNLIFEWRVGGEAVPGVTGPVFTVSAEHDNQFIYVSVRSSHETGAVVVTQPTAVGAPYVSPFTITDIEGNRLYRLTAPTLVTALNRQNDSAQTENLTLIVAVYTPDGRLKHVGSNSITIAAGDAGELRVALNLPANADGSYAAKGYYVNIFLWDSVTFTPVDAKYAFPR